MREKKKADEKSEDAMKDKVKTGGREEGQIRKRNNREKKEK